MVLAATLFVCYNRQQIAPGYGKWVRIGTVVVLIFVGSAAIHWLGRGLSPPLYRRLDPATAGTLGFVIRLLARSAVVVLALRIAGVNAGTLAVGGAFTAVLLGLAAQQALGGIFAGIVLQSTRPFRVGERVRLVGGALAGSLEGTVSSLGLFYTTLSQGADRLMVPTTSSSASSSCRCASPTRSTSAPASRPTPAPSRSSSSLLRAITVPTRYRPSVSLEEVDRDGVVLRINATPLRPEDGSQLAEEVLEALRAEEQAAANHG